MRSLVAAIFTLVTSSLPVSMFAQGDTKPQVSVIRGQDGGTSGRMESLFIPPLAGAPFSLILATEWSRPLGNGGTFTLANQRRIVRDGGGRIYQERWILVPKGSKIESHMDVFQITDPGEHIWYNCGVEEKVCEVRPYSLSTNMIYKPPTGVTGAMANGSGFHQHEELGLSTAEGVDTAGYRETTTINPGVFGNDRPMVTTREFWYSAKLGINLLSKVDDPQSGTQSFTVKELSTSEPDPKYFQVSADYKIITRPHSKGAAR